MRLTLGPKVALLCTFAVVLCWMTVAAEETTLECSEVGMPPMLRLVGARQQLVDFINKVFRCIEKSMNNFLKITQGIVRDVTGCFAKFPADFFKCLAKLNVPQKLSDFINEALVAVKCAT